MSFSDILANSSDKILAGLIGGLVVAVFTSVARYIYGWYQAGQYREADIHIAGTMYTRLDPQNPAHAIFQDAMANGKTHVQELLWLSQEIRLSDFLANPYILRTVSRAMSSTRDAGIMLGKMSERTERPLLKKILGLHNTIPATDLVRLYKSTVGTTADGRVVGCSPPTHEQYSGSPHRRVLRAMFVADSQLRDGLPPKEVIHFSATGSGHRYDTISEIIADYRKSPEKYARCRAYF